MIALAKEENSDAFLWAMFGRIELKVPSE